MESLGKIFSPQRDDEPSKRHIFWYALPAAPLAAMLLPLVVYVKFFYNVSLGVSFAAVGAVMAAARIWDIITDPIVGALSDKYPSKFGRRRHWILIGAPILMLGGYMIFIPPFETVSAFYLAFWMFFLYVGWTIVNISHTAWGGEISTDYNTRSSLQGWREFSSVAGMTVVLIIPAVVQQAFGGDLRAAVGSMGVFFLVGFPIALFLAFRYCYERPPPVPSKQQQEVSRQGFLKNAAVVLKDKLLVRLLIADLFQGAAPAITGALYFFVARDLFGITSAAGVLLLAYFVAAFATVPAWLRIGKRFGKHRAFSFSMFYGASVLPLIFVVYLLSPDLVVNQPNGPSSFQFLALLVVFLLYGVAYGAGFTFLRSMTADLVDRNEIITGQQRAGAYFSLYNMTNKLSFVFANLTFPILAWIGYDPEGSAVQPVGAGVDSGAWLIFVYAGAPMLFLIAAGAIMWNYPLDKEMHKANRDAVDAQHSSDSPPSPDPKPS